MAIEWLGPYRIVGKLGRGGMGTVYEGVHRETGEPAAIKLLSAALAEEEGFRVRFEGEIESLRKLRHPNIVRLFGFGQQDGHLFYSMELVDGNSLEEQLGRGRRFDWHEVVGIGIETCSALRHAHDRGVIHRDIKPGNLLLSAEGHVKLSDFGIARLFGSTHLTMAGNVVGTAQYMAPEQAAGLPVDARSDLYSLGALLYTLLARRPVFRGNSLPELLQKQRFEPAEPLRKHAPDAPEELEHILGELLEKDPARRIANAGLLGRRLEAMLHALSVDNETVAAGIEWFDDGAPSATSALPAVATPGDMDIAVTVDRPTAELPATQCLPQNAPTAQQDDVALIDVAAPRTASESVSRTLAGRGSFVPVREEELDPIAPEEPRPGSSWPQTGALSVALLAIGLIVWWFLQPPSPDALHAKIEARMEENPSGPLPPSTVEETQRLINDFLIRHPRDSRAARVREHEKDIRLRGMEWELNRKINEKTGTASLLPIQQLYSQAIGDSRSDPARAVAELEDLIDLYGAPGKESEPIAECLTLARRRLEQLRDVARRYTQEQLDTIERRLAAADAMQPAERADARKIYQAVVNLYAGKPWAAGAVDRARKSLENSPRPQP